MKDNQKYKIKLLAPKNHSDIPEGYYGDVPGVSMNHAIYSRVSKEKAFELTKEQALYTIKTRLGGWPLICEPPLIVKY